MTAAGCGFLVRALLRLPMPILVLVYLANDVACSPMGRSPDCPDGAAAVWAWYLGADPENIVLYPVAWLTRHPNAAWPVLYAAATLCYVAVGCALLAGWRPNHNGRVAGVVLIAGDMAWRLLGLLYLVPCAVDAVQSGENQITLPRVEQPKFGSSYFGEDLIHAYEWLLVPWAVAIAVVMVTVFKLLRSRSARAYFASSPGIASSPGREPTTWSPTGR